MAAFRPELFTIEEVLAFYDQTDGDEYKVYAGTSPNDAYRRYHFEGEKEIGMQELTAALMQLRGNSENYNPYLIQVITPPKGKGKAAQPSLTSITFQLNRPASYMPMQQQSMGGRSEMLLEKLVEQNSLMMSRISALETEEEFDEPVENEFTLGSILQRPEVQTMLIGAIGKLFENNSVQATALAGIPEEKEVMIIVENLMSKGVTVEHLRKLNDMNNIKLQSLLLML
jgi:hypothetical protein